MSGNGSMLEDSISASSSSTTCSFVTSTIIIFIKQKKNKMFLIHHLFYTPHYSDTIIINLVDKLLNFIRIELK